MNKRNAKIIGIVTVVSYIANYFLRNLLGVLTPTILETTNYTKEYLALLSSTYMISYAIGQFLNGILGDVFKPKSMILTGLLVAGAVTALFPIAEYRVLQIGCFLILGYSLSMLRGPLMKIITENTTVGHSRIICVFFSFSSFVGPLIASLMAMIFRWKIAFVVAGVLTNVVGLMAWISITVLENKGMISIDRFSSLTLSGFFEVFKINQIPFYIAIACLAEIAGTPIMFWLPTFFNEYIGLDKNTANFIFSFMSLISAVIPFVTLAIYKLFKEKDVLMLKWSFFFSFVAFMGMLIVHKGFITLILLLITRILNSIVSALLWSIYIPSLGSTGRVSSINGIMDCIGYISAGIATSIFSYVVTNLGWKTLIAVWGLISIIGVIVSMEYGWKNRKISI